MTLKRGINILLVDDSPSNLLALQMHFCKITTATSSEYRRETMPSGICWMPKWR